MRTDTHSSTPVTVFANAPRQRDFLRRIQSALRAQPWLDALWLSGSGAAGSADRWSSVDLHCLLAATDAAGGLEHRLSTLLNAELPEGWTRLDSQATDAEGRLEGITHTRTLDAPRRGGVPFQLHWCGPNRLGAHLSSHGPIHLLWTAETLPEGFQRLLTQSIPPYQPADESRVLAALIAFWQQLARLPGAVNRQEHLAASALLHRSRDLLTELVVALNGATRPRTSARINPFLGPAQRDAFEKTLAQRGDLREGWIGQAVALIVLYRWYAPQLVELYNLAYPAALEETVLALLSAEVPGWPARITTG